MEQESEYAQKSVGFNKVWALLVSLSGVTVYFRTTRRVRSPPGLEMKGNANSNTCLLSDSTYRLLRAQIFILTIVFA